MRFECDTALGLLGYCSRYLQTFRSNLLDRYELSNKRKILGSTVQLTLREERKLRVFENMVLRRIFEPKRDEITGEWRRLHYEELNDLYSSPNIVQGDKIEKNEMGWTYSAYGRGEGGV